MLEEDIKKMEKGPEDDLEAIKALTSRIIVPVGAQLKKEAPWYPQKSCGDLPHQSSALSLGESTNLKYGISYPLRSGLDTPDELDFAEDVLFNEVNFKSGDGDRNLLRENEVRKIEEIYVSRGACLLSEGPFGGPSFFKGLYRPLTSYSTGVGIRTALKCYFAKNAVDGSNLKDGYLCLVERGGISFYADGRNESHAAYMPEFYIDKVVDTASGIIVVPDKSLINSAEDSKFLYILTHPIKQVSRIWCKTQPGSDFYEFDSTEEKLLSCDKNVCVFWALKKDKFILRRLVRLEKKDVVHSTTLNASMYYSNQETPGCSPHSPFTPAGGSISYSPLARASPRTVAMRVNREGNTVYYWPSFDFTNTSVPGLSAGFYPPHYSVYDDPEYYLTHMFEIELNPSGKWIEPEKFEIVSSRKGVIGLWFKISTNLYLYSVNTEEGSKVSTWAVKNIKDFVCSKDVDSKDKDNCVVVLTSDHQLQIGWLDDDFNLVISVKIIHELQDTIFKLDKFLFGDTLICSFDEENYHDRKGIIQLRNVKTNDLIHKCTESMKSLVPSEIQALIVAKYVAGGADLVTFEQEWKHFCQVIVHVIELHEEEFGVDSKVAEDLFKTIKMVKENMKATRLSSQHVSRLSSLMDCITSQTKFFTKQEYDSGTSLFKTFLDLLIDPNPTASPMFASIPEVMQILLDSPDSLENLKKLAEIKSSGQSFAPVLEILIADVFNRNENEAKLNWPRKVLESVGRADYLCALPPDEAVVKKQRLKQSSSQTSDSKVKDVGSSDEEMMWTTKILTQRVFSVDRRLEEVCRLLDSASPLHIELEQRAEMSDHDFVEEQEKHLLQLMQISFSAPVGRTAFTLRTELKDLANLTNVISIPKLCTSGKCATRGTTIELSDSDVANSAWPSFHNAVASCTAVKFSDHPTDAWFAYNKAKTNEGPEQAGMVLGFGLNGILTAMPPTLRHDYLAKENSFTSMAMLLGLSANLAGTGDIATWKVISLHIGAMLPACTTELEIPKLATLVAPCSLGLLFMGTQNSHVAKVLLGEISKRYNPLGNFGGSGGSAPNNANSGDSGGSIADREAHSLCAGFGLGFVNLSKCRKGSSSMDEDGFEGILRRFVVGGPKPSACNEDEDDPYSNYGQALPSLWEEFRCCHIEEGDNVNVDVTTPSAIVAVALTYLKSGNEAVLYWLSPPTTLYLLDGVRPDILMLRSMASILVFETIEGLSVQWLELHLMPKVLRESALKKPSEFSRLDHESINQAWASIVCGYCLGIGIRLAGTSDDQATKTLWHYVKVFLGMNSPDNQISEYFPKNFLESSVCTLLLGLSLILAGSGDIKVLRLCRLMQAKVVTATQVASNSNTYGLEMCVAMATGILFLGGGRYSLSNDDKSIAVLLASVFPKWPINANDNRYHLQALRHLYLLAAQPRLILTKPLSHRPSPIRFTIEYLDGRIVECEAPVLLPPFHILHKVSLSNPEFLSVEFVLPADLEYLKRIVEGDGVITLVPRSAAKMQCGFLKQMKWRESRLFHQMFQDDDDVPEGEVSMIKELNMISRISEIAGLTHVIPSLLAIKNGDSNKDDWVYQARILYWWTSKVSKTDGSCHKVQSYIPSQLLGFILSKASPEFKIF